jgi:death-on-curing protein
MPESAVRAMHAELIAEYGGREGLRDEGLLFRLAVAYGAAIVRNHPFVDGNKRVAIMVMYVFLEMNGYRLEAPEVEAVDVMLRLADGKLEEEDLSVWLKRNSVKVRPARSSE